MGTRILSVEDDERIRTAVKLALEDEGWTVDEAGSGEEAVEVFQRTTPDVVLIDIMLPGIDGFELCRTIRRSSDVPIVMVTARNDTHDVVAGLEAGADDYLTKPFSMDELLARLQALLRRSRLPPVGAVTPVSSEPSNSRLRRDNELPRAWLDGEPIELTRREWVLLGLLMQSGGQVVSREAVIAAWQADEPGEAGANSNALEVYVHRLRRKLANAPIQVRNIRGLGYLLEWQSGTAPA